MLKIGDKTLLEDELSILLALQSEMEKRGIPLLRDIKPGVSNIQITCPVHSEGQENRPSCGVATSSNGKVDAGTVHCFTCGFNSNIEELVSICFGYHDFGSFGKQWLIKNFLTADIQNRKEIDFDFGRGEQSPIKKYVSENELDRYRYTHPYMYKRKMTDDLIEKFDIGYDPRFKASSGGIPVECITFPVRDKTGGTLFIARRAIHHKMFHYPSEAEKPIYGIYELPEDAKEVIICESIIDAITCYLYGKPAIALLGLGSAFQIEQLKSLPIRKYILGLDGDKRGRDAAKKLKSRLEKSSIVTTFDIPDSKDINDLSKDEFLNLIEFF